MSAEAVASPDQLARRREAIETAGWGKRIRFFQPHNLCFWTFIALVVIGAVSLVQYVSQNASYFAPSYIAGAILFGIYGAAIWLFLRLTDRYGHQPGGLIVAGFVWGGLAATFAIALIGNEAMLGLYGKLFSQAFVTDWGAGLTAPFVEETAKAAGFILLMALAPQRIRSVYDGIFIGAFIGLGFEILEDITYAYSGSASQFGAAQIDSVVQTFAIRGATGVASHALYTAIFCAGLVYLIGTPTQPRRAGIGLLLIGSVLLSHGAWDSAAAIGGGGAAVAVMAGIVIFSWTVLIVVLRRSGGPERDWMRAILDPEISNGTITQDELDALVARRKARKRFIRSGKGHKTHRNAKHVLQAADDLGLELARSNGEDSPGVDHARAEIARLRAA